MALQNKEDIRTIVQAIFDKKGFNILVLDIRAISNMADYFIVAEGSVERHVKSLCTALKELLPSKTGLRLYHTEGEREGDWIVMDCGEIVIHLFTPDLREKYALEEVWSKGKIVDIEITIPEKKL